MAEYIDTSINPADYIEVWEVEDAEHGKQLVMAVDDLKCLQPADVVPWSFLERYADWFCALVQYPEFIREAKRFYKDSVGAMEGGEIDG